MQTPGRRQKRFSFPKNNLQVSFARCGCPSIKSFADPFSGVQGLETVQNNFYLSMKGQLRVARPAQGVVGETPDIFPAASDHHLVCLQHDDSAQLLINNATVYTSEGPTAQLAGFKQFCVPINLEEGWHDVEIRYINSAQDAHAHLR